MHTRKLTKEDINALPPLVYKGPIHFINKSADVDSAVHTLMKDELLGFDTETRPTFKKGESYPPSLLQLSGSKAVYIFQLRQTGLPASLMSLLSDPSITKAGVAIGRDIKELQTLADFNPAGFIDLGVMAHELKVQHHGLRGLAAVLLNGRISKSAKLTNWAMPSLPEAAVKYAATDAWIGRQIFIALSRLKQS